MQGAKKSHLFDPDELYLLYRRGQPQHIKALYEKGEVYINPINFIRYWDDNAERSDPNDGILSRDFWGETKITFGPPESDMSQHGPPMYSNNLVMATDHIDSEKGNIYCSTALHGRDLVGPNGERPNLEFNTGELGESLIVIRYPQEFIRRVLKALKENGFENVQHKAVEYHPDNYSGYVGFFRKHERFNCQKEYRIFVQHKVIEPIQVSIGPLNDIAAIEESTVTFEYTDGVQQVVTLLTKP
jgi:hypothetical protein